MARPNITKQSRWISLSYWVSPTSEAKNYVPTISPEEDNQIRQWVNENYDLYGDDYKMAAYRDAQQAVLDRKATVERKTILERERKERAEKAAYEWDDRTLNEQKQLARAENAINDAATLIKQWQEANWIKVDKTLTNKETVDKFLEANLEMPYAEYVNKFLDAQTWKSWDSRATYDNKWLAAKLWLLWWVEWALINAWDKLRAGTKWFAQWVANLAQNTLWAWAEYLASNLVAWLWEIWYWAAEMLWADVSEGTAWDKMKKMKWYDWKESQRQASSEDLFKEWMLTEDVWAYNVWETLWELTTDIALTAPAEWLVAWRIAASALPKAAKTALQALNLAWWWASFQLADDAAKWELSDLTQYAKSAWINVATAWLFNAINKLVKWGNNIWFKLFWPKWQERTAVFTQTPEQWAKKTEINKAYAKNKNEPITPYTEIANDLEKTAEATYWTRVAKWKELEAVEWALQYWEKPYTANDVISDLEFEFSKLWWWPNAKLPKFTIDWKTLTIDKEWLKTLNSITKTDGSNIKLWDEILQARNNRFSRLDKPIDATNTKLFIDDLKQILKDEWYKKTWWETIRAMKNALNWVDNEIWIVDKFNNSLSEQTSKALSEARTASKWAITTDENLRKVLWVLRNEDMVWKVWAAEKALWWKAQMEQLFKEINEKYWIDMNNEILSWAYNMSLYDVKKAEDLLSTFYPSEPWMYELALRYLTKRLRRWQANRAVELWEEWVKAMWKTSQVPWIVWWEIGTAISTETND